MESPAWIENAARVAMVVDDLRPCFDAGFGRVQHGIFQVADFLGRVGLSDAAVFVEFEWHALEFAVFDGRRNGSDHCAFACSQGQEFGVGAAAHAVGSADDRLCNIGGVVGLARGNGFFAVYLLSVLTLHGPQRVIFRNPA